MAAQEQQVGINHRMGVDVYRSKAREFIIKENVDKLKLNSKARLIDLQVSLKSIPAKSAINDIAGEFIPMPDVSHRLKEKKKGIAAFLKSKLWGWFLYNSKYHSLTGNSLRKKELSSRYAHWNRKHFFSRARSTFNSLWNILYTLSLTKSSKASCVFCFAFLKLRLW